ncbi:MAG: A/G-specific adenine glycosylase [Dethiosulfovibrio peptidovorans]|nr:MAG: A/G-specific adenine glycosylase [Dethiosulfovibrio peptidovorans]
MHTSADLIANTLLRWFKTNQRDLPWRRDYTPYQVWISESMLQQTQMDRVVPYYLRWMEEYPTLETLARSREEDVLRLWEGLGYYSRAKNLRKAAEWLRSHGYDTVPGDRDVLTALPGVGPYTAGAILSIAYQEPVVAVDGNVRRVFARLGDLNLPTDRGEGDRSIRRWATEFLHRRSPRAINQAVMEFGASICTPKPRCNKCLLSDHCLSLQRGTVAQRPVGKTKNVRIVADAAAVVIVHKDKIFLRRRANQGLWAGLWEFPWTMIQDRETHAQALQRELGVLWPSIRLEKKPVASVRHSFTKWTVTLSGYQAEMDVPSLNEINQRWVTTEELRQTALPAGSRKLREQLFPMGP